MIHQRLEVGEGIVQDDLHLAGLLLLQFGHGWVECESGGLLHMRSATPLFGCGDGWCASQYERVARKFRILLVFHPNELFSILRPAGVNEGDAGAHVHAGAQTSTCRVVCWFHGLILLTSRSIT